jgi:hypothetical protein
LILDRAAFAQISAVEGVRLTPEMLALFEQYDRDGLSADQRRSAIVARFAKYRELTTTV